jgi:hypothetical protein
MPQPSPEGDQQPEDGGPRFVFVPGSVDDHGVELSGPVPPEMLPGYKPDGLPAGLDWKALIDGLAAAGKLGSLDQEQEESEDQPEEAQQAQAYGQERPGSHDGTEPGPDPVLGTGQLAAQAVQHMPPGPALGGWLEVTGQAAPALDEDGLTGVALATCKQAARAQAMHLAAVAQLTARTAAADRNVGLLPDGRPAQITRDALGQIEMALSLSHEGAQVLADQAITLTWRLPRTGAALAAGVIDLERAKIIAQSTSVLPEDLARQVEAQILPRAATMTTARLRRRLTALVITADPEGAEARRKDAELLADVRLYADDDHTATLVADKLPQVLAASGYARINALAWARKKAGLPGTIRQHRAHILLELILGTLDFIPPPEGAPPDQPPPPDDTPPPPGQPPPGRQPPHGGPDQPAPEDGPTERASGHDHPCPPDTRPGDTRPGDTRPGNGRQDQTGSQDAPQEDAPQEGVSDDDFPAPRDEDAPEDDGLDDVGQEPGGDLDPFDPDDLDPASPPPVWPKLGTIPPALARASRRQGGLPPAALLDLTLPWSTYAGLTDRPATLGRIGAITADQARQLARAAEEDPAAQWRIIVITSHDGHAIAVTRIRRRTGHNHRPRPGPPSTGPPAGAGLTGRVTLIISEDTVDGYQTPAPGGTRPPPGTTAAAALRAAARALQRARNQAAADTAAGGCAHTSASPHYRPPTRLREHVIARDQTCRSPICGQPAWRGDLDHTRPYDQGGQTCPCNLGGACRREHQLKQHPRWKLEQIRSGWFRWRAPSGRTYEVGPEEYTA